MTLLRNVGTIGGLTAFSRIFGFLRDMLLARLLGAGLAADAFQLAFLLPNIFRRMFAEGAFSLAFVPLYSRALHSEGGEAAAARFAEQVLAVFVWVLLGFSALAMLAMPGVVWLLASDFTRIPGKFDLAVALSRVTFPYLGLVSVVAMFSGLLNARGRFAPGAFVPVLLNFVLIAAIGVGALLRRSGAADTSIALTLAGAVTVGGAVQLAYIGWATRRAGVSLRLAVPRVTPEVRRLAALIVPATLGAGIYQFGHVVDTFFATSLPQGSLTLLKYADRLHQLPLGIIGYALGTAMLPMLARHIQTGDGAGARSLQAEALEMATLVTLPAAAALAICAPGFVTALFVGGRMTAADGAVMAQILVALACGVPAYVLVKVLQPAFFAREDTRTPMAIAGVALVANIGVNLVVVPRFGIVGLAGATAFAATLNGLLHYAILHWRGWFSVTTALATRIGRQLAATLVMAAALWVVQPLLADRYGGDAFERLWSLVALVGAGLAAFFTAAFVTGALDKHRVARLLRRRPPAPAE
ncbi:MAG: murein biosynthesis integral membrane protein MurJ [Novosphingobium sp.]